MRRRRAKRVQTGKERCTVRFDKGLFVFKVRRLARTCCGENGIKATSGMFGSFDEEMWYEELDVGLSRENDDAVCSGIQEESYWQARFFMLVH